MAVGAVVARILTQYSDKGSKAAQKDIGKLGKQFDAFAKKSVRAFGLAAAAVGAFAIKVGKDAVQAAIADQKSQVLLANSLRNTTGATDAAIASVESYISKLQVEVGVVDDELRPSLAKLAAVTGSVSAAQGLLATALDVSAFAGVDLGTATTAVTRALQGNFRGLQKLVPSISTTAIKAKDLATIFEEVNKATQGSAAARANTLEYRLAILRIRFGEILETLGYKLLPIIEKFAIVIQNKVLPQIEMWIAANGEKLVAGLQAASQAVIILVTNAISFSNWITNNMGLVKTMATLIAGLFVVSKVAAFATILGKLTAAFVAYRNAAGAAAVATAFATGGASIGSATAALLAVGGLAGIMALKGAGNEVRGKKAKLEKGLAGYQGSPGASDIAGLSGKKTDIKTPTIDVLGNSKSALDAIIASQNKLNNAKKKELSIEQKIVDEMLKKYRLSLMTPEIEAKATAAAIKANQERQKSIAGSPTVNLASEPGSGPANSSLAYGNTPIVNITINTPHGTADDYAIEMNNRMNTIRRREGIPTALWTR
jgi:hypothetical protein